MSQPLPLNFLENPLNNIQTFIKFHQANASLGLALLSQNQAPNPFFLKRSNLILSMNQKGTPLPPMGFDKLFKPAFPQNLFEQKFNQAQLPFPFINFPDNLRENFENAFRSRVKVEDSHHSDVTKDSESVKKEEDELVLPLSEEKVSKTKVNLKSKKIIKTPKTIKPSKKSPAPQSEEGGDTDGEGEGKKDEPKWRRKCWSHAEDKQLLELIEKHGKKWSKMATIMGGRTGKQVRDRYLNVLIPDIKRTNWTDLEDRLIWALYFQLGTKWCKIAEHLPGRTEGQVKNRFYTYLKRKSEKEEEEIKNNLVIQPDLKHLFQTNPPTIAKQEEIKGIFPKIEA